MSQELSAELLARYGDARIPRYTSYPTAPHFSTATGEADYRRWLAALPAGQVSVYVHVPFCAEMCWYCGCHTTVARRAAPIDRYIAALREETALVADAVRGRTEIGHLHFGGGTPTAMAPEQMRGLISLLREAFCVAPDAELAIEIDPRTFTPTMAQALVDCGFNRASLGVQSFDPVVQQAINRVQSFEQTRDTVRQLRDGGIERINFDLIYGLPHQSLDSCLETVEQALRVAPDRFAVFGYAHVPSFKPHQRKIDAAALAGAEDRYRHSRAIAQALVAAGFVEIGLDHFARPDDPLAKAGARGTLRRNFQGYTTDTADALIGLGASSIGRMPQGFVQNEVRIGEYQRLVGSGRLPVARGYRFCGDDRLRAAIIERLMCDHRVDVGDLCRVSGADPAELLAAPGLEPMIRDGLVERNSTTVALRPHARPLVRALAAAFDAHLAPGLRQHSTAV